MAAPATVDEVSSTLEAVDLGEEVFAADGSADPPSAEDMKFDAIIGTLEEIIMDPEFRSQHESFCRENCHHFDDCEENKLVYSDLFARYTEITEKHIEARLEAEIEGFSMSEFAIMLESRADELAGDVFDVLMGFGDFEEFKSLMLSYKEQIAYETSGGAGGGADGGGVTSVASIAPTVVPLGASTAATAAALAGTSAGAGSAEGLQISGAPAGAQEAGADSSQTAQTEGQVASEAGLSAGRASGSAGVGVTGDSTGEGPTGERS